MGHSLSDFESHDFSFFLFSRVPHVPVLHVGFSLFKPGRDRG